MKQTEVQSLEDLRNRLADEKRSFLLIYKKGSEQSDRAFENFDNAAEKSENLGLFTADVNLVRDIHPAYSVSSAPTILEFKGSDLKNLYKGAHDSTYYRGLFENAAYVAKAEKEGKKLKQVTVYTTPTCSWCTTLKSYLKNHKIRFTEVDISRDEDAAKRMTERSGQQGVPQTLVGGEMVVGFDKSKLNRLLEIQG